MMNNFHKTLVASLFSVMSLFASQQANAEIYTYTGEITSIGEDVYGVNLGDTFSLIYDLAGDYQDLAPNPSFGQLDIYQNIQVNSVTITYGDIQLFQPSYSLNAGIEVSIGAAMNLPQASFSDLAAPAINPLVFVTGPAIPDAVNLYGYDHTFGSYMSLLDTLSINKPDNTDFLDAKISLVSVVPEPSSYAMFLLGLGLVGMIRLKR